METRILIPEALSIVTSTKSYANFHESTNKDLNKSKRHDDEGEGGVKGNEGIITRNKNDRDEEEIEKPTSSSGCIDEILRDETYSPSLSTSSNSSDDVLLPLPSRDSNSSCSSGSETNSVQSVVSSGEVVASGAKRHTNCSVSNSSGVLRDNEDEDVHSDSNDIVSSADTKTNQNDKKYAHKQDVSNSSMCQSNQKKKHFVKICANQRIEKGAVFSPNDGEVRVVYLTKAVSQVPPDDIRFVFGCFDRVVDDPLDDDKEIRLCNWIRFVKRAKDKYEEGVNVVARFSDRQPVFELTRTLLPGTELLIFFDIESITQMNDRAIMEEKNNSDNRDILKTPVGYKPDGPLDLSKCPLEKPKSTSVSDFPNSQSPTSSSLLPPVKHNPSFSSIKTTTTNKSPTIFSISNVLQPIKLFQPYSISHTHHHHHHTRNSRNDYSRTLLSTHANGGHSGHVLGSHSTNNTSSTNGLLATTPSSIGSSSPSAANSPTLRPILRTRGRERSLLPCDVCGKAFDRPSLLKRHMRTHTGEKPHICDVCSKGFSTSSSLNTHRRIHSGEKPHQCPICGKRFTASSNLYYHRMTHNKEKPHKCLLCGKSFPTPGDLKSHQYVHSGSWPYNCPICHRGFSKQTNLRNHLLLHSGDKPHNCQICGKKFALACNLRAHLRTHEEDPISSCASCKRTFLSSLNMLVNGHCRSCLLQHQQHQTLNSSLTCTNNSSVGGGGGTQGNKNSGVVSVDLIPVSSNPNTNLSHVHSLTTSPSSITATVSPDVSHTLNSITGLQVPTAAIAPLPGFLPTSHSSVPFFHGAITDGISGFNRPNPFLEQLFEWNYRFAKETAGNLGLHFQQKLLESQMLAAQLMSVSNSQGMSNIGLGISDILRLRSQEFSSIDASGVNKFVQQ